MKPEQIIAKIKDSALENFNSPNNRLRGYIGYAEDTINNHNISADVIQQRKISNRVYNAIVCRWYLDGKKSSLAKVIEAIS